MANTVRKELTRGGIVIGAIAIGIGLLALWRWLVIPLLSPAFLVDGSSAQRIQLLLMVVGVQMVVTFFLVIWVGWLTTKFLRNKQASTK
jgi:hypothetical protein